MKTAVWILGVIVAIAIIVGGWFGFWALAKANRDQQYQVNTNSQEYQQGLVQQEQDRVQGYDAASDATQKAQIKATFCSTYQDLTHPTNDLVQAQARICQ
jgi:uncharacterized membrane protein YcjF (UPF0283 family)